MKKLQIIFLMVFFIACSDNKIVNKVDAVRIIVNESDYKTRDYRDIIDSLYLIKLETNENSIIGGIRKIVSNNRKFFILDKQQNLIVFDENGKYLNKLNRRGKGPGEYIELRDFFVDENDNILVLSWKKILTYNSKFECLDEFYFKIESNTGRELNPIFFMPTSDFFFMFMGSFGMDHLVPGKENALYCINRNKKIINEFFPVEYEYTHLHRMFYNSNNEINYTNGYGNDTIYKIINSDLYPKYTIDFQGKNIRKIDMMNDRSELFNIIWENELKGNISNVFENNEFLCFQFLQGRSAKQIVFDKKTGIQKTINVNKSLPFPAIIVAGLIDSDFFSVVEPYMVLQMNTDGFYDELISDLKINNISATDNPIIFKYKFKNINK